MPTGKQAVLAQRLQEFQERQDVRDLGILLVAGLLHPFDYVDKITDLALSAGLDAPIRFN